MIDYDSELRLHQRALRRALDIHRSDRVLDIGCGAGATTREVARTGSGGITFGIDIAKHALRLAQQRTEAEGQPSIQYNTALPAPQHGTSAFSLGDADTVQGILHSASFVDVTLEPVREPVYYGPDVDTALAFVMGFSNVTATMDAQSAPERERVIERLCDTMTAHRTDDGVSFDSRAWIVAARRN